MEKETKNIEPEHIPAGSSFLDKQNNIHALAYIPYFIGAALAFFLGKTDKRMIQHHAKYSLMLSIVAVILMIILNGFFASVVNIAYFILSGYLAYKAFKGEAIKIELLDMLEEKIRNIFGK